MIVFYIFAYAMLAGFFLIEGFLRKGGKDRSKTKFDHSSTAFVSAVMGSSFILLFLSLLLDYLHVGTVANLWVGIVGILVGITGLITRCVAFSTLGRFFTRTLQETENHVLITTGIYRYIRHPGYLSDILFFLGVSMTLRNWIPIGFVALTFPVAYIYRIITEEKMLIEIFGEAYIQYCKHTKRLLPFIF